MNDFKTCPIALAKYREEEAERARPVTQVELEELPNFNGMVVTYCGDENMYFKHEGNKYFCKIGFTSFAAEVELSKLSEFDSIQVTHMGKDTMYFTHKGWKFYTKIA